jgi:DNA-binding MarR family transcriptional regulator
MKTSSLPALPCLCASFRRATRALTQHYDEAMRPTGLRATQFTLLQALSLTGEVTQGRLGQILAMDSTTLTRTLEIMTRHGWVAKKQGKDRRERRLGLTKAGQAQFERALPRWDKLQADLRRRLGAEPWDSLMQLTRNVTTIVTE